MLKCKAHSNILLKLFWVLLCQIFIFEPLFGLQSVGAPLLSTETLKLKLNEEKAPDRLPSQTLNQPLMGNLLSSENTLLDSKRFFRIQQAQYFSNSYTRGQANQYTKFHGRWGGRFQAQAWAGAADLRGLWVPGENTESIPYFVPTEAYVENHLYDGSMKVGLGIKKQNWSEFDRYWSLGLFEPQARWDALNPHRMGLAGTYIEAESEFVRLRVLGSGVFIPSLGPQVRFRDGNVESGNRWFAEPFFEADVFGESKNISYSLEQPDLGEILLQSSYVGQLEIGSSEGAYLALTYADKPANQVFLTAEVFTLPETVQANVKAQVIRHKVSQIETGFRSKSWKTWLSFISDRPEKPAVPTNFYQSELAAHNFLGLGFSHEFEFFDRPGEISYGYLKRWDEREEKVGLLGSVQTLGERYPWKELFSLAWSQKFEGRWEASTFLAYSALQEGGLSSLGLSYRASDRWKLSMIGDLIADFSDSSSKSDSSFFRTKRTNDRISVGVTYVF